MLFTIQSATAELGYTLSSGLVPKTKSSPVVRILGTSAKLTPLCSSSCHPFNGLKLKTLQPLSVKLPYLARLLIAQLPCTAGIIAVRGN